MAISAEDIKKEYPLLAYRFHVNFDGQAMAFSEVSGLQIEYQTITYFDNFGPKYMPGMSNPINFTLSKGVIKGESTFYTWINSTKHNVINKKDFTISLLDEEDKPVVVWSVQNAFPIKLSAPSFDAKTSEVAIDSLDLMADSLKVEYL